MPVASYAGPIEWSYTTRLDTLNGAPWLSLGTVGQWAWSPETGEYYESHRLYQSRWEYESSGMLSGSLLSLHPSEVIVVGGVIYPEIWVPADLPVDRTSDPAVRIAFMLTDAASGETGEAEFVYEPYVMDDVYTSGTGVVGWKYPSTQSRALVLGGNQYTVTVQQQIRESWTPLLATVEVAGVPEPGTLFLGGLGIGSLGLVRFSRRRFVQL